MTTFNELTGSMSEYFTGGEGTNFDEKVYSKKDMAIAITITAIVVGFVILMVVLVAWFYSKQSNGSDGGDSFIGGSNSGQGTLARAKIAPQRMMVRESEDPLDAFDGNSQYTCPTSDIKLADYRNMELDNFEPVNFSLGFVGSDSETRMLENRTPNYPESAVRREDGYQHWGASTNAMINLLNAR